jgi:hypothetical protein
LTKSGRERLVPLGCLSGGEDRGRDAANSVGFFHRLPSGIFFVLLQIVR